MNNENYRKELSRVIEEFDHFCEVHSLKYYLIGGGLIGAVRHGGFIPWDDDIDVGMSRQDYEKLISLTSSIAPGFQLGVPLRNSYSYPFAKFFSTRYRVQEKFNSTCPIGVWVDVFPLDATFRNAFLRWLHFRGAFIIEVAYMCGNGSFSHSSGVRGGVKRWLNFLLKPIPSNWLFGLLQKIQMIRNVSDSLVVGNILGKWREKEFIDRNELANRCQLKFENMDLWTFANYDTWLKRVYGSYMNLPEEHERLQPHPVEIFDGWHARD